MVESDTEKQIFGHLTESKFVKVYGLFWEVDMVAH